MREGQVAVFEKINGKWHTLGFYLMCPDKCRRIIKAHDNIMILDFYNNRYLKREQLI